MANRKLRRDELRPQQYEHRVEMVIEALGVALSGCQSLTVFLQEQLGTEWRRQDSRIKQASKTLRKACSWLKRVNA